MQQKHKHQKHLTALLIWLAIYPLITLLLFLLGDSIDHLPLAVRTLILTIIAVPAVYYFIVPFYHRIIDRFIK